MPIYKSGDGYRIENVKAKYKTKKQAVAALRAIKANQAKKKDKT